MLGSTRWSVAAFSFTTRCLCSPTRLAHRRFRRQPAFGTGFCGCGGKNKCHPATRTNNLLVFGLLHGLRSFLRRRCRRNPYDSGFGAEDANGDPMPQMFKLGFEVHAGWHVPSWGQEASISPFRRKIVLRDLALQFPRLLPHSLPSNHRQPMTRCRVVIRECYKGRCGPLPRRARGILSRNTTMSEILETTR